MRYLARTLLTANSDAPFYQAINTNNTNLNTALNQTQRASFTAFDQQFFNILGPSARLEKIASFAPGLGHVHEAPVYIPEINSLLFADTSLIGTLQLLNLTNNHLRNITTTPPLWNVNGGTYHRGRVYLVTNGSPVRGVYQFNYTTFTATPVVNNYRGRKLNSPNDLVFDKAGNIWFTDPAYGWTSSWPGVEAPQLPNAIYAFNPTTGALNAATNGIVNVPNGLAFSGDGSVLYVADSNSSFRDAASVRNIIAFDVKGTLLSNPRLIFQNEVGWPDGLRVTQNGYLIIASQGAADIVDPNTGVLLGKINCPNDTIFNVEPIPGTGIWFLTGTNFVYKVTLAERSLLGAGTLDS